MNELMMAGLTAPIPALRYEEIGKISDASGTAGQNFGYSAAVSANGDTVAITAWRGGEQGYVFIYTWDGSDYNYIQTLSASDGAANNIFGNTLAFSSDGLSLFIGAYGSSSSVGAVYHFTRTTGIFSQAQKITPPASTSLFGISLAVSSDKTRLVIGASGTNGGTAVVFTLSGGTYTQSQILSPETPVTSNGFGSSISISSNGTYILVGAPSRTSSRGAAFLFTYVTNSYVRQPIILASDGVASDQFGHRVSFSSDGTTAAIAAIGDDDVATNSGSVYIFTRSGNTMTQAQKLTLSTTNSGAEFGASLAMAGNGRTLVISAPGRNGMFAGQGCAYIFKRPDQTFALDQELPDLSPKESGAFGSTVCLSTDAVALGVASMNADGEVSGSGGVIMYRV